MFAINSGKQVHVKLIAGNFILDTFAFDELYLLRLIMITIIVHCMGHKGAKTFTDTYI